MTKWRLVVFLRCLSAAAALLPLGVANEGNSLPLVHDGWIQLQDIARAIDQGNLVSVASVPGVEIGNAKNLLCGLMAIGKIVMVDLASLSLCELSDLFSISMA